jgi:4-hydroxy 2-oxovalerate aldolase
MKKDILIIDSTLRDGSHAIQHRFTVKQIEDYAKGAERAGVKVLIVGHGNGLGASSLQVGQSLLSDQEMLTSAKKQLKNTKLGAFLLPGFGTIKNDIRPAIDCGLEVLMVGAHCTEANITKQHIKYSVASGLETYGVLLMSHMISPSELLEQAKLMAEYGAKGVLLMDSAGAYMPQETKDKVKTLARGLDIEIGFHAHNNLGLAVSNSINAVKAGASFIDTTSRGLGAGAGNCQMEVLVAVLNKMGYNTGLDLYKLMDNSEDIISKVMEFPPIINSTTLASGLAGIFSGFKTHAEKAAKKYRVDVRDIFMELGKRKAVAGQEDMIVDVALYLKQKKELKDEVYQMESLL